MHEVTHLHFLHWSLPAVVVPVDNLKLQGVYQLDQVWRMVAQVEVVQGTTPPRHQQIQQVVQVQLQELEEA
jgi:hypothetical protein